jgi:hypothetical protein
VTRLAAGGSERRPSTGGRDYHHTLVVLSHYLPVITAKLISILAGLAANFAMSHFIVFRPRVRLESPHHPAPTSPRSSKMPIKISTIRRSAGVFVLKTSVMSLMAWLHDVRGSREKARIDHRWRRPRRLVSY